MGKTINIFHLFFLGSSGIAQIFVLPNLVVPACGWVVAPPNSGPLPRSSGTWAGRCWEDASFLPGPPPSHLFSPPELAASQGQLQVTISFVSSSSIQTGTTPRPMLQT